MFPSSAANIRTVCSASYNTQNVVVGTSVDYIYTRANAKHQMDAGHYCEVRQGLLNQYIEGHNFVSYTLTSFEQETVSN